MPKPYGEWRYKPLDFYRLDDRTGFKVRASRERKEWQNLIVANDVWEIRHPQDFVRGTVDDQNVHEQLRPRPAQDLSVGPLEVTLVAPPTFSSPVLGDEFDNPAQGRMGGANFIYAPGSGFAVPAQVVAVAYTTEDLSSRFYSPEDESGIYIPEP